MSSASPKIVIVGGGPAGLMAAQRLAGTGHSVVLFEAKSSFGRKFLMAGRGGLNLTHSEPLEMFLTRYGPHAGTIHEQIVDFPPSELRAWCQDLGIETFVGSSGRVFPECFKASPLLRAWLTRLHELGVSLRPDHRWIGFKGGAAGSQAGKGGNSLELEFSNSDGNTISCLADAVVLALGGASWARLGSDGAWAEVLESRGVHLAPFRPSNCGFEVAWRPHFAARYAGQALKNLSLSVAGQKVRGELTIAEYGVEGGGIYALGRTLRLQIEQEGSATLFLDLKPDLSREEIARRLHAGRGKDSLASKLRKALNLPAIACALLRESQSDSQPTSPEVIAAIIKSLPLKLTAPRPFDRAISTDGGVKLESLDRNMMIKSLSGVFAAGEMLDWDAPTGGYLLQATFATAIRAAAGVEAWLSTARR